MTEYMNAWKNYVNFTDRTTVRGYWMAFLFHFIASIIISIILMVIFGPFMTVTSAGMAEIGTSYYIFMLWGLAYFLPGLAIQVRRLRDAGKHWAFIFINFIPLIGTIIYIVLLCGRSTPDNGVPVV